MHADDPKPEEQPSLEPVEAASVDGRSADREEAKLETGIALCLSGGGSRALLFHVGALWRLNELGLMGRVARISSVSGGSIVAGVLGMNWTKLGFDADGRAAAFGEQVVKPLRAFSDHTHDVRAGVRGFFGPGTTSQAYAGALARHLFGAATLQDLPDEPRFVINASNIQSTALFRFSKPYVADYRVGRIFKPDFKLADAVAASGAFPPFFAPFPLDMRRHEIVKDKGNDLHEKPYTERALLADGGLYDNLGLETIYKRYRTLLVSDGGGRTQPDPKPATDWIRQPVRTMKILDLQVRNLRYRMLMHAYNTGQRDGAYWGIRTNVASYGAIGALPCPYEATQELAKLPTRLSKIEPVIQERLVNWGYASADASLRALYLTAEPLPPPTGFPYPGAGVG